jgi:CheY-like chemotaxis protein
MYKNSIPCLAFPTRVVLLDDEQSFLDSMRLHLGRKMALKTFRHPEKACTFFNEDHSPDIFWKRWILQRRPAPCFDDHVRDFDIDVRKIREEMYNRDRFYEIAVVVVDYAMPSTSGLEFCRSIEKMPFKRILLTGEADEKIAVKAFNEGLIHRFIRKDDPRYLEQLNEAIVDLEGEYFQDLSESVITRLVNNPNFLPYGLKDPAFVSYFNHMISTYRPAEFYLTGSTASYIFLSFDGTPSWLAVKDESEMISHTEIAETADEPPSDFTINALRTRQAVPYFYNEEDGVGSWDPFIHPAETFKSDTTQYYAAYLDDPHAYEMDSTRKIFSYKAFLARLD